MNRTIRTDFAAVNGKGVVLYTFNDRAKARDWARENAVKHDGLRIEEHRVEARTIYTPRKPRTPVDFDIPAYEGARA